MRARSHRRFAASAAGLALVLGLPASAARAQAPNLGVSGGIAFESYRFQSAQATGIQTLSLFTLPIGAGFRFGRNVTLDLAGAYAHGMLEREAGGRIEVTGLTDTQLRLGARFGREAAAGVEAIVVLPTGHATHTADEALVAGAVAADLLPFRISNWGSGGAVGLGTSWRRSVGPTGYGVRATYLVGREFEPMDGHTFAYRPGDQLRVGAGLDHRVGPASKLTLSGALELHRDDALDGSNLFRAGNRFHVVGSYSFPARDRGAAIAYAGAFHRMRGTALLDWARDASSQTLIVAGAGIRLPMDWGVLVPSADTRVFRSQDGVGQGFVGGAGALAEVRAGSLTLVPSARARVGRIVVRQGSDSGILGLELGMTARIGERRP